MSWLPKFLITASADLLQDPLCDPLALLEHIADIVLAAGSVSQSRVLWKHRFPCCPALQRERHWIPVSLYWLGGVCDCFRGWHANLFVWPAFEIAATDPLPWSCGRSGSHQSYETALRTLMRVQLSQTWRGVPTANESEPKHCGSHTGGWWKWEKRMSVGQTTRILCLSV